MKTYNPNAASEIASLVEKYNNYSFSAVVHELLSDPKFRDWTGSGKDGQHHFGRHGLATHTLEIINLMLTSNVTLNLNLDEFEIIFSGLFHDSGKLHDYSTEDKIIWTPTPHRRLIHHVSRSGLIWSKAVSIDGKYHDKYHDIVWHNILAHHGLREHGSPVMPKTQTAWLLHLCDSISARMNDADTLDMVSVTAKK
jgi:3'-5' exoribonuclease